MSGARGWAPSEQGITANRIRLAVDRITEKDDRRDRYVRPFSWLGEPGMEAMAYEAKRREREERRIAEIWRSA